MKNSESNRLSRCNKAIAHCNDLIIYYERTRSTERRLYFFLQSSVIILGALTPVLILWTDLPKSVQALPSALASIAAGVIGVFQVQENWVASKDTAEALKGELLAFEMRATEHYRPKLHDDIALDNFIARIEGIHKGQISGWRARQLQKTGKGNDTT